MQRIQETIKHSAIYTLPGIPSQFIGVILVTIYTRIFVPADYGIMAGIALITPIVTLLLVFGIEPEIYNIDPANLESKIRIKNRAILPVHLYGQPADMNPILELARKYNLTVIEDCAQALGAKYYSQKSSVRTMD